MSEQKTVVDYEMVAFILTGGLMSLMGPEKGLTVFYEAVQLATQIEIISKDKEEKVSP